MKTIIFAIVICSAVAASAQDGIRIQLPQVEVKVVPQEQPQIQQVQLQQPQLYYFVPQPVFRPWLAWRYNRIIRRSMVPVYVIRQ